MPASRTLAGAARELQSAANRLALMNRDHTRDTILARLFPDVGKGQAAAARIQARSAPRAALEAEVKALREELGKLLDEVVVPTPPPWEPEEIEPPTKKRKKRK